MRKDRSSLFIFLTLSLTQCESFMTEELQAAVVVLVVGMITVFFVLSLVVLTGRALIYLVNRSTPGAIPKMSTQSLQIEDEPLDRQKIAAIVAAVDLVTEGRGRILVIEPA